MKTRIIAALVLLMTCSASYAGGWAPADPEATPQAKALFERLMKLQKKGTMYGHQDDLLTGRTWINEKGRSDTKEAVGDYPAVAGFELGELELGYSKSLDGNAFSDISERIRWFHEQGGIITISWHVVNPVSSQWPGVKEPNGAGSAWDVSMLSADGINAVRNVLPGGEDHEMFNSWLKRLSLFFHTLRDKNGNPIPFIFRPYHEHSGSFFWWGRERCTDEEYADLWRYTVDFLKKDGHHSILYAYNTDKVYSEEEYLRGYPGDEYIDMLSIDWYGRGEEFNRNVDKALEFTTRLAQQKKKLHALSECGPLSTDLLDILSKYESSYVLTWRHIPPPGNRPPRKTDHDDLLRTMKAGDRYLFFEDIR